MKYDIITIFPNIFTSYFNESILARAQKKNLIEIGVHDLRQWTADKHKTVDDSPYGGGPGMVMKIEPIYKAVQFLKSKIKNQKVKFNNPSAPFSKEGEEGLNDPRLISGRIKNRRKIRVILFSAKGKPYTQADARRLAKYDQLILICGRYEGVDERVAEHIADEELSVGNFVLTGGEIPAMIVVDTVSRLLPGVLGKKESLLEESFSLNPPKPPFERGVGRLKTDKLKTDQLTNYLEYPQYTRPEKFKNWKAPEVLLSGDHKKIAEWRLRNSKIKNQKSK